jgi:hypothetical protein
VFEKTPPCRVQRDFEPAFAGWVPPPELRLGRSLSRYNRKIGTQLESVGSKPECSITRTAGYLCYTTKEIPCVGDSGLINPYGYTRLMVRGYAIVSLI